MFESKKDRIERLERQVEALSYAVAEVRQTNNHKQRQIEDITMGFEQRLLNLENTIGASAPITNDERAELEELREFKRRVLLAAVQGEEP